MTDNLHKKKYNIFPLGPWQRHRHSSKTEAHQLLVKCVGIPMVLRIKVFSRREGTALRSASYPLEPKLQNIDNIPLQLLVKYNWDKKPQRKGGDSEASVCQHPCMHRRSSWECEGMVIPSWSDAALRHYSIRTYAFASVVVNVPLVMDPPRSMGASSSVAWKTILRCAMTVKQEEEIYRRRTD